jgi:hypothetical protein
MNHGLAHPLVYEINTWAWLYELGQALGREVTLGCVPQEELQRLAAAGFDALWLMGVWQRSPAARQVALNDAGLQAEYGRALPDFGPADVVGSPYAIYRYEVDASLGGDTELADLRRRMQALGLRLILDFVPNHLAIDHPWVAEHPERLVQGDETRLRESPGIYFRSPTGAPPPILAHGRDPNFSGWTDTVQLDLRRPETRQALGELLLDVARRSDGVRCDMAMLVTREVFLRTWGGTMSPATAEFWPEAIARVKAAHPEFLMLGEVYWDLEYALQQQGFDYVYDKRLYDRLLGDNPVEIEAHLRAPLDYQRRLARFVENHDEPRAESHFGPQRHPAAALLALGLPGLRLVHEGQLQGRQVRIPVQLRRRPAEPTVAAREAFYGRLLPALRDPIFHQGCWELLEPRAERGDNASHRHFVAYQWTLGNECRVVVANLTPDRSQCFLPLRIPACAGQRWLLVDVLSATQYRPWAEESLSCGVYLDLPGYGCHLLRLDRQ